MTLHGHVCGHLRQRGKRLAVQVPEWLWSHHHHGLDGGLGGTGWRDHCFETGLRDRAGRMREDGSASEATHSCLRPLGNLGDEAQRSPIDFDELASGWEDEPA
jgi:hypothetical protein